MSRLRARPHYHRNVDERDIKSVFCKQQAHFERLPTNTRIGEFIMAQRNHVMAKAASEAGAAFLDTQMPNWHRFIRSNSLNIGDGGACALGQLMGDYRFARLHFKLSHAHAAAYGFNRSRGVHFKQLTHEWRKRIAERRQKDRTEEAAKRLASTAMKRRFGRICITAITAAASICIALL